MFLIEYSTMNCGNVLKNDDIFSPVLNDLNDTVYHYLKTGKIISDDPSKKGHSLLHYNSKLIYDNKDRIMELAMKFFDYLPDDIIEMQKYYVISPGQPEQINIRSSLNIEDWTHTATNYSIETKIPYDDNFDFWHNRRRGLIKNKITEAK